MGNPVRVLHVLHSMNCGGAETLIMNIYRSIDREKVQFDFLVNVFDKMFYEDEILSLGGRIFRMPFLTKITPVLYEKKLCDFFREHSEIKTVHSHLETTTGIILKQAKKAGVPVRIAHSHNSRFTGEGARYALENAYKSYCRSKVVPNATKLFSCSELAGKWLYGSSDKASQLILNGIDTSRYAYSPSVRAEIRRELEIGESDTVFGHIGRFNDQKNHLFLMDIFSTYLKNGGNGVLLLAGEGDLLGQVRQKAAELGISESVNFLGLRSDIPRLLQAFDMFLLPSKFEGLPLVIVEAQAAGLPCLAADTISSMADLGCSLVTFLPIDSAEKWAEKMSFGFPKRKDTSKAVAAAGYDIKKTAKMLEKFYTESFDNA